MITASIKAHLPANLYRLLSKLSRKIGNTLSQYLGVKSGCCTIGPTCPILVNSIPKSGTNLLFNIIYAIPGTWHSGWEYDMSLAVERHIPEKRLSFIQERLLDLSPGCVYTGHISYSPEIAEWLRKNRVKQVFISRDPRDVTVSAYHYIMNVKPRHPYYETFERMGSDSERLLAFIRGFGEGRTKYRWSATSVTNIRLVYEIFMNWATDKNTLAIRFEDLIDTTNHENNKAVVTVRNILEFLEMPCNVQLIGDILKEGRKPDKSPTFRRGVSGSWKEEYTEQHIKAFKEVTGDLLDKLNYTWD